jgi:HD-GYP domain-containing protein (c-di-GMP phosphodiesterase class II)
MDQTSLAGRNAIVRTFLEHLDTHGPGERAHAERVAVYATATGYQMGLRGEDLQTLRYAGVLHDVGKVRVDPELLAKLGTLSDDELAALRMHAELAVGLLESHEFLLPCMPMIRHHHERWGGGGYPSGLTGEEIPLGARIIAASEAFDAMTYPQGWRSFVPVGVALDELRAEKGRQFDPTVVEAFETVQPLIQPVGME